MLYFRNKKIYELPKNENIVPEVAGFIGFSYPYLRGKKHRTIPATRLFISSASKFFLLWLKIFYQ